MSDGTDVPLARLFAMAYRVLVDDLHDRLRARGWTDVRPRVRAACRTRRPDHDDRARRAHGHDEAVEAIYAELEREWCAIVGADAIRRLRRDLARVVTVRHDGELPPVRPTW